MNVPVTYLSSAAHPHDRRPGALIHFFLFTVESASLEVPASALQFGGGGGGPGTSSTDSVEAFYLGVLDTVVVDRALLDAKDDMAEVLNRLDGQPRGGSMHAAVNAVTQRILDVATVTLLMLQPADAHELTCGLARPETDPSLAIMSPSEIVPLLPVLCCNASAPIIYLTSGPGNCDVLQTPVTHTRGGGGRHQQQQQQMLYTDMNAGVCTPVLRCSLLPPAVLSRRMNSPAHQSLLYRRLIAMRRRSELTSVAGAPVGGAAADGRLAKSRGLAAAVGADPTSQHAMGSPEDILSGRSPHRHSLYGHADPMSPDAQQVNKGGPDGGPAPFLRRGAQRSTARSARSRALIAVVANAWIEFLRARGNPAASAAVQAAIPLATIDEESEAPLVAFTRRISHEKVRTNRRRLLLRVDTTAGATAFQEIHSQVLINQVVSTINEKVYRALGAVTDLVGAAMSYQPNWTLIAHPQLGREMRATHFALRRDLVMLDGNRYGVLPVPVRTARREWEQRAHVDPVLWRFKAFPPRLETTIAKLAQRLLVLANDLQLFCTLNHAAATVFRSLPLLPGDKILMFGPTAHSALLTHIADQRGVQVVTVALKLPLPDNSGLTAMLRAILKQEQPQVVLFSHMHPTGKIMPATRLVTEASEAGAVSVVDGTDVLGAIKISMAQTGADFYFSRLDGYFFCPAGVSVLYTHPRRQQAVSTLTVSYYHGDGYDKEWTYTGLMDTTVWICVMQALQFQKYLCSGFREYINHVANEGHKLLCEAWQVQPVVPLPINAGVFAVALPGTLGTGQADALHLQAILARAHVHVGVVPLPMRDGTSMLAARVTCHVYNDLSDIKKLALAVLKHAITTV